MSARCHRMTRTRLPLLLAAAGLLGLVCGSVPRPALANPLPEAMMFVHVHPPDGSFCTDHGIASCGDIVQYTSLSGVLEFDVFLVFAVGDPGMPVHHLSLPLELTMGWSLLDWEFCQGGVGTVTDLGNHLLVDADWPGCPPFTGDPLLLVRLLINVTGFGELAQDYSQETHLVMGCPPEWDMWPMLAAGQAGVECSYCYQPCSGASPCHPVPATNRVQLTGEVGELLEADLPFQVFGDEFFYSCTFQAVPSASWLQANAVHLDGIDWNVHLTVDTSQLAPGFHWCWLRGEADCTGCAEVWLQLQPPVSAVPDPPPEGKQSWGRLKSLYR
jgi:hypothetical protein